MWIGIGVSVISLLVGSFFIFKYIRRRNIPKKIRARYGGILTKIKVAYFSLCFRCERFSFRRPKVQPRQELNSTDQLNIARSTRNHESIVSGSDGYIDVLADKKVEPLYEELDHSSEPTVGPYDVPPPPCVLMDCITTSSATPDREPHYENAKC
jgi:hypothetical protein